MEPMKSVPVEKCCEKCVSWVTVPERIHPCSCHLKKLIYEALDELKISNVGNEAGIHTVILGKPIVVGKLLDMFSQALQAAKEEERKRIVLEIEEKMKTRGRYYLKTVENGGLYNEGLEDATAIVNKHQ